MNYFPPDHFTRTFDTPLLKSEQMICHDKLIDSLTDGLTEQDTGREKGEREGRMEKELSVVCINLLVVAFLSKDLMFISDYHCSYVIVTGWYDYSTLQTCKLRLRD